MTYDTVGTDRHTAFPRCVFSGEFLSSQVERMLYRIRDTGVKRNEKLTLSLAPIFRIFITGNSFTNCISLCGTL